MEQENRQVVPEELVLELELPTWPTSKAGPPVTPPPPGMRPQVKRTEQMVEIGYNQVTGEAGSAAPERSLPSPDLKGRVSPDEEKSMEEAAIKRSRERHQKRPR